MTRRLLLVDDDPRVRTTIGDALVEAGFAVRRASSGAEALKAIDDECPDIVLSDVRMPSMDGLELLKLLRERVRGVDVVLMTAFDDMPTVVSAMREGAAEFLVKPIDLDNLLAVLRRLFEDRAARRRTTNEGGDAVVTDGLIGRNPGMILVYKRVGQAARNRATVLIRGESGTGKEIIARAIHDNSEQKREPFVAVNCAALPQTLLESELFGHVRGSFTGAVGDRRGRFAQAASGTIFLDEIGDTTPEFQTKLLRVLQAREYTPVGADRVQFTSARVIAATHRDLEGLLAAGSFREDLYYRLRVFEIAVLPLRDRMSDLPLLAQHLMQRAAAHAGVEVPTISEAALQMLHRHSWPGNVRELENCITRAVLVASGGVIRPEHITTSAAAERAAGELVPLSQIEREHIARVLAATGGNKSRAARILRVSRAKLARLLQRFGMDQ
jgi:DNA-binding NtrC family response regulator